MARPFLPLAPLKDAMYVLFLPLHVHPIPNVAQMIMLVILNVTMMMFIKIIGYIPAMTLAPHPLIAYTQTHTKKS
jgi:hypothetical protein